MRKSGLLAITACLLAVAAGPALASGFSIYEQSAKASGQAGAWIARADDAAANWYNPASLVRLDGMEIQFGINAITIGSDTEFTSSDPMWGLSEPTTFKTESSIATPIHLYFSHKINDRWAWGLGINNPYGLITEWTERPVTYSSMKAELVSFVVNPNVAFAINEFWSIALGIDYMYADVSAFSREVPVDLDTNGVPDLIGVADLTGTGDAWGWNGALKYAGKKWDFGLTYRAELEPEIDGDLKYTGFEAMGPFAPEDTTGKTTLALPAQAALGVAWRALEKWTFEFDISWAGWSNFKAIDIQVDGDDDIYLREDWDDTQAYRLGVAWQVAEKHQVRFGALMDSGPVPADTLRPSIPDSDRKSVTFGYGYMAESWGLDFYYMPLFFDDITANGSAAEGVINGEYTSFVHLLGVTFAYRF
jgi:long-chain fatty acid transport protein